MGHIAGVIRSDGIAETMRLSHCDNARAAIKAVADDTLLWEPGTRWQYSNFGWQLVGAVVEAAAGDPFLEFMDREVFTRAGMEQSVPDLENEDGESVKYDRAAYGTLRRGPDIDMSCPMAAGGFLSTPTELVQFGLAMVNGQLARLGDRQPVLDAAAAQVRCADDVRLRVVRPEHSPRP